MFSSRIARLAAMGVAAAWLISSATALGAELKPEEVVARHLESIGTPEARAFAKSRVMEANAHFKMLVGGVGLLDGSSVLVSEQRKLQFMLKFPDVQYSGERFICDGDKVQVISSTAGHVRSSFADFVYNQDAIVKEGLLGGVLSTAWPLFDLDERKAKLSYEGLKNVDGRSLHDVHYRPKKSTDLDVHLYFEPETFRHVLTVYTLTVKPSLGHHEPGINDVSRPLKASEDTGPQEITETSEMKNARQQETRYRLEERFSDFGKVDGLTLPAHYNIHFSQELGNGATTVFEWDLHSTRTLNNINPDARNFQVR
ncbi:MAG: hypothetical protein LAO03_03535 [Acidobacteriia bacterium]|nr:hypothetical protein [Terriglobia bacterium]